jgi:hypothetical protein
MRPYRFGLKTVSHHSHSTSRLRQRGSIALGLIVIIVLALATYASAIARRHSYEQSCQDQRNEIQILESALTAVTGRDLQPDEILRLPRDESEDRWIRVTKIDFDGALMLEATSMDNDKPGLFIRRESQAISSTVSGSSE